MSTHRTYLFADGRCQKEKLRLARKKLVFIGTYSVTTALVSAPECVWASNLVIRGEPTS